MVIRAYRHGLRVSSSSPGMSVCQVNSDRVGLCSGSRVFKVIDEVESMRTINWPSPRLLRLTALLACLAACAPGDDAQTAAQQSAESPVMPIDSTLRTIGQGQLTDLVQENG